MTHQEIKALAGHRAVPPWIMKLVSDAIAIEREACAKFCEETICTAKDSWDRGVNTACTALARAIRARGEPTSRGEAK